MIIEEMVKQLSTLGRRRTDPIIWESVLYYYASIMLNKYNFRKTPGASNIGYYSIIFAGSGIGKSWSMKQVEKLCGLHQYADVMISCYKTILEKLPEEPDNVSEVLRYMPKSVTIGVEGTAEGLYQVAQSQQASKFGSLNLATEEFGESIGTSSGLLSKLKELHDGVFKSKVIKGDNESSLKADIEGINCNFIGLGSKKGVTAESKRELTRIATSGLYRRSFIIDSKAIVEKNTEFADISKLEEYMSELNKNFRADFIQRRETNIFSERFFDLDKDYHDRAESIDDELIDRARKERFNEFAQYDTGSMEIIESLAHIIAFLEWDTIVGAKHLDKAFSFFKRTRGLVEDTFRFIHPYKLMYDILHLRDNMTISEMAEIEGEIPIMSSKVKDNIALLEELCYRNDEILIKNEGKVTRFRVEKLPVNKLDKLIVSINNEDKGQYAINFSPLEMNWEQLHMLVQSEKVQSFTTAHFEPTKAAPNGHREAKSYIEGANVIAFDIDEGMTLDEAKQLLSKFTYLIYTSKSHNIEKYDYRDRFRILLPTKNTFYVTPDQHKQLYINVEDFLGLSNNDVQTRNTSRLWYTNPETTIHDNKGEMLDVTFLLPNTDKSEDYIPKMQEINAEYDEDNSEASRRMVGMIKWAIQNAVEGHRNETLYHLGTFAKDMGMDPSTYVDRVNNMINDALPQRDIAQILRSVDKK
jgi:predicted nuclease of restriction endonuclease-like (RecB) superfamily